MIGKSDFPHTISITRLGENSEPPYTANTDISIWSGDCDSQIGGAYDKQFVAEATHTVFSELIPVEVKHGDKVKIIKRVGWTPILGVVVQVSFDDIFTDNGKAYGTTIWVKETKN